MQEGKELPYIDKDQYYAIKNNKDNYTHWLVGHAGINASYSGKWFGGYAGKVKTSGGLRDYMQEAIDNCREQSGKLAGVTFVACDYRDLAFDAENSVIYCDPPYRETTGYASSFDHDSFYEWCRDKRDAGALVLVSEYDMPSDFECIFEVAVKSSLSANGNSGGSKRSTEKLFRLPAR